MIEQPYLSNQLLLEAAKNSLQHWLGILSSSDFALTSIPSISLDQRGTIAGSALLVKNHIRLNPRLMQQNKDYFYRQVIPHELAHLAVFEHFGKTKPHGREWRHIMQNVFQCPAKRCHSMDVMSIGIVSFEYKCECGTTNLSIRRHNKVMRGKVSYICRKCNQSLVAA